MRGRSLALVTGSERAAGADALCSSTRVQETGHAWAEVLLGDTAPSGKLPVTFPLSEDYTVPPCKGLRCEYTEGLMVGWRALHYKEVAYPFGHGLSCAPRGAAAPLDPPPA